MDTNKTTTSSGMLEGAEYEKKLKQLEDQEEVKMVKQLFKLI